MPFAVPRTLAIFFLAVLAVLQPASPAQAADSGFVKNSLPSLDDSSSPYWLATSQGDVWNFGSAGNYGSLKGQALNKPIAGITPTNSAHGYWLVASDGGVFAFGDAAFYGSTGAIKLNQPIVAMTSTPSGNGYWMVAKDGGIFAYGDAKFFGSTGSMHLNKPIVGMASTPDGNGYWLVASDGGIFAYGNAAFYGSTGSLPLNRPIVSMSPTPTNKGYWLVASDGGIFAYGDAAFYGSPGGGTDASYQRLVSSSDNKGYWLIRNGGDAFAYGSAQAASAKGTKRPAIASLFQVNTPGDNAVLYAMAQLGKAYVWGGNGPDGYDCSGLTSQAWKSAGTSIPRVANDQYDFGTHVGLEQVRPGDLLFWTTDQTNSRAINHVGMYIGGGWGVNAGGTGTGVNIRSIPRTSGWMMSLGVRPHA